MYYYNATFHIPIGQYKSKAGQSSDRPHPSHYNWVPVGMISYNSERKLYLVKIEQFSDVNNALPLTGKLTALYIP